VKTSDIYTKKQILKAFTINTVHFQVPKDRQHTS